MEFTKNETTKQKLRSSNMESAQQLIHYLKDNTVMDWKTMTQIWIGGYKTELDKNLGSFHWMGGSLSSPTNYQTTIQYLLDHGYCTFQKVNGFKIFVATKKTKHTKI